MKKLILKITFATALAVVAGVTAYQAQDKEMMSDLALANVRNCLRSEWWCLLDAQWSDMFCR